MKNSKNNYDQYPDNIIVIGGGRWARVITEVLCNIVPSDINITIHTFHNIPPILEWLAERHLEGRVQVSQEWPKFNLDILNIVIIVNAARDHEKAIRRMFDAGVPVLVEKPVTLAYRSTKELIKYACNHNIFFASAHIFLFSQDIKDCAELISKEENIKSIKMYWVDPKTENRYGETKRYDSGLPIFVDLLPHIISIIGFIVPYTKQNFKKLEFLRGGAHLNIDLSFDEISCHVKLVRNGNHRRRVIEIDCGEKCIKLDFANEPGTISINSIVAKNHKNDTVKRRPSEKMLLAYMHAAVTGECDSRLNVDIGLRANMIIDQVLSIYNYKQKIWLIDRFSNDISIDDNLHYSLSEILQLDGFLEKNTIDLQIEKIQKKFMGKESSKWLDLLYFSEKPVTVMKSIVN